MSDAPDAGFGKFIPGFDFLQNLAKGAAETVSPMPNLTSWIAPTVNLEDLEKRISELKAVHFWLDQNSKALGATVQALEVQKMTLAALKGMNFNVSEMANALASKTASPPAANKPKATEPAPSPPEAGDPPAPAAKARKADKPAVAPGAGLIDPMQLWGALTQQFQQIAASAMKDAGTGSAMDMAKNMAGSVTPEAGQAEKKEAAKGAKPPASARKTARKPVNRQG